MYSKKVWGYVVVSDCAENIKTRMLNVVEKCALMRGPGVETIRVILTQVSF